MKAIRWKLGGIGKHREDLEIPIEELGDAPLVAICGDNGTGKTTMIETLPGAIYGDTPSRGPLARLANRSDSFVDLGMEIGGEQLEAKILINGTAKTPKTEAYLSSGGEPITSGKIRDFKAAVAERLPSQNVYLASGFAAQGGGGSFLEIKKGERKELFLELLGSGRLAALSKAAGEKHSATAADIAGKRASIEGARSLAGDLEALGQAAAGADAGLILANKKVSGLEDLASAAAKKLEAWQEKTLELSGRVSEAKNGLQAAQSNLSTADLRVKQLQSEVDKIARDHKGVEEQLARREELAVEANKLDEARARVDELETKIADLRAVDAAYRGDLAVWQEKRTDAESSYREAKAAWKDERAAADRAHSEAMSAWNLAKEQASGDLKRAASEVELLTAASGELGNVPCAGEGDYAGCPLIAAAVEARAKLDAAKDTLFSARDKLTALAAEPEAVTSAAAAQKDLEAEPREVTEAVAVGTALGPAPEKPDLDSIPELERARNEAQDDATKALEAAASYEALSSVCDRAEQLEADGKRALGELEPALAEIPPLDAAVNAAAKAWSEATVRAGKHTETKPAIPDKAELAAARAAAHTAAGEASAALERLAAAERAAKSIAETQAEIDRMVLELDDWAELRRAFGKDGIQALEIDAAGPDVSDLVNELLHSCYGPRFTASLETTDLKADGKNQKEIFDLRVIDSEAGTDGSAGNLSGGEKVIVAEALGLAIAIYNARRSDIPIEDVFRDEVAGALSSANAVRYVEMLRKAVDLGDFHRIYFIAHQPHLWPLADARLYFDGSGCRVVDEVPVGVAS